MSNYRVRINSGVMPASTTLEMNVEGTNTSYGNGDNSNGIDLYTTQFVDVVAPFWGDGTSTNSHLGGTKVFLPDENENNFTINNNNQVQVYQKLYFGGVNSGPVQENYDPWRIVFTYSYNWLHELVNENGYDFIIGGYKISGTAGQVGTYIRVTDATEASNNLLWIGAQALDGQTIHMTKFTRQTLTNTDLGFALQAYAIGSAEPNNCFLSNTRLKVADNIYCQVEKMKSGDSILVKTKNGDETSIKVHVIKNKKKMATSKGYKINNNAILSWSHAICVRDLSFLKTGDTLSCSGCRKKNKIQTECKKCVPIKFSGYYTARVKDTKAEELYLNFAQWYHLIPMDDEHFTSAAILSDNETLVELYRTPLEKVLKKYPEYEVVKD